MTGPEGKAHFVRGMFDSIAGRYDLMNRLMTGWQDERWRALAADAVYPETVKVALDIGAGTGDLSLAVARRAPGALVIAADFSECMLRLAQRKRQESQFGRLVAPVMGDALSVPVASDSVDAVVSGFVMRNVADLDAALAEIARVLRPGGRVAILELTPLQRALIPGFRRAFDLYFGALVPLLGGVVSGRGFAYRYLPDSVKRFPSADMLAEQMRAAGLVDVTYQLLAMGTLALHTGSRAAPRPARTVVHSRADLIERTVTDSSAWNDVLARVPNAHILQSYEWAELKRETGWDATRIVFEREGLPVAAASVSRRAIPGTPFGVAYCQKGPALDYSDSELFGAVLRRLSSLARAQRSIVLKVDPDVEATSSDAASVLRAEGFTPAREQIQTRSTVINDLRGEDSDLLGRMSSSWRRYVKKAQRDGVTIRTGTEADLPRFYELTVETGKRDRFFTRPYSYYESAFRRLTEAGLAELFLADVNGTAEAALFACSLGTRAWYLWGASSSAGQEARAPYFLQWHTMQWARTRGCESYDLWGAPDDPRDKDDPLSGVYYFKRGFGGRHVKMVGVFDYVTNPALHALWERALPRYISLLRKLKGGAATPAAVGDH